MPKASQTWRWHARRVDILTSCRRGTRAQQLPAAGTDMPIQGSKAAKWKQQSSQLRAAMQAARPGQVTRQCDHWAHEHASRIVQQGCGVCSLCWIGVSCDSGPQAAFTLYSCLMWRRALTFWKHPSLQHCAARRLL